jgi:uncharacterized protein (TIGR02231 family)
MSVYACGEETDMTEPLTAPVTAVTVFGDGARVRRDGRVRLTAGSQRVVIGDLPDTVDPSSVRVSARGTDLALVNVDVRRDFRPGPVRDESARLRAEVDRLRDALQALDDSDAAERAGLDFLGHLSEAAATGYARAISFGRLDHDEVDRMTGHLTSGTADALERRREIAAGKRTVSRQLEAAEKQLAAAEKTGRKKTVATITVTVTLEAGEAAEATIELTYQVSGASWRPLYDLTLDGDRLAVTYLAEVTQQTGEDWTDVGLVLSTARRGAHQTLPELTPWYIGPVQVTRGRMRPQAASMRPSEGAQPGHPPDELLAEAAPVTAARDETSGGLVYRVQRPMSAPSDGQPHKTTIALLDLEASVDYLTIPVLAPEAYQRATVTNTSQELLLPGQARVFRGGAYIGETRLDTVAAGEEFELQLGVDDQIRVERKLLRRQASRAMLGVSRTVDIGYEITVANHRPEQARITVKDHFPVATDGEIKVRLRETSPVPAEQNDLGELTWPLTLADGDSAKLRYRFTVEYPAQVKIAGL